MADLEAFEPPDQTIGVVSRVVYTKDRSNEASHGIEWTSEVFGGPACAGLSQLISRDYRTASVFSRQVTSPTT
jgi:hypothetical protein